MRVIMVRNIEMFCFAPPHPNPLPQGERGFPDGNELAMGIPSDTPGKVMEGLEGFSRRGIRYPIPFTGALADMTPGLPKIYLDLN